MWKKALIVFLLSFGISDKGFSSEYRQILKENITKAEAGDYIVTAQGKNYTLLHVWGSSPTGLIMEEISIPLNRFPKRYDTWKKWYEDGAYGNTCHIVYNLNLKNGSISNIYSYTQNCWMQLKDSENYLSKLLNLYFRQVPKSERKKVGAKSMRSQRKSGIWNPKLTYEGKSIPEVSFEAWKTKWPSDGSELSSKMIEIYLPEEASKFPMHFPYWVQISGFVGKAKVRIIDSGKDLKPLKTPPMVLSIKRHKSTHD